MKPANQPTKESVRAWLYGQIAAKVPPPTPQQIRHELGWGMLANNTDAKCAR